LVLRAGYYQSLSNGELLKEKTTVSQLGWCLSEDPQPRLKYLIVFIVFLLYNVITLYLVQTDHIKLLPLHNSLIAIKFSESMEMTIFCLLAIVSSLYQTAEGKSAKLQTMNGIGVQYKSTSVDLGLCKYQKVENPLYKTTY
jgi:hypothetical protein